MKKKILIGALLVLSVLNSIMILSAIAQSDFKPSVPEFSVKYVDRSYTVPENYTYQTNPYNGEQTKTGHGEYRVNNQTLEVTIKNQPYTPFKSPGTQVDNLLCYNVSWKGHYEDTWHYLGIYIDGYTDISGCISHGHVASESGFTTVIFGFGSGSASTSMPTLGELPENSKIDFRVQALFGYYMGVTASWAPGFRPSYSYAFTGQTSEWSNTQTIAISETEASPVPNPTLTPAQTQAPVPFAWTDLAPQTSPPSRANHMMAYDSTNDVAVMFGGWNGPYLNDTWIYSFQDNTWINKSPPESPSPRERGGLVYASKHNEVILYGGYNGAKMLSETWVYSVDENRWTQLFPYVSPPSALNMVNLGMVYDSKDDVVIMFSDEGNTWVYDITANTWRNMQPSVSPSPRALSTNGEQMVYDASTDSVLLFGGSSTWNYWLDTEDSVALGDTWAYNYNANTWTNLQPTPAPDDRLNAQMVFDSVNNIVVLYGGAPSGQNSLFNDTWIYRGASNSWEKATSRDSPPVRYASAMAFSPLHNQAILFGGYNNLQGKFFSDTWAFTYSSNPAPTPTPMQSNSDLFSVDSNSTVTDLAFNSASRELSFKVTGPSETTGYVHTIIAKSLLPDVSSLKVYLDGNQLNYTATNQQDSWDIYFTYNHSTHSVEMHLGNPFTNYVLAAIIVIFIITIVSILLSVKRRNKDK